MMTRRKFLSPPSYGSLRNPITGVPRARKLKLFSNMARRNVKLARPTKSTSGRSAACAETEAFLQYGPPQSFFQLSWLALQKARAREVGATMMTRRNFLSPPLLWLAPQSDHGSAACAETEAFFHYGPPQSFFELSWLALHKARAREVGATMMTRRKFLSPPLLWLAPQSDHGSAACAETEAFFQYGPPQSFFQLSWLALQKARREVGDKAQISKLPLGALMARSAIRSRECRARGN